jgi:hypothetical protein
VIGSFSVERAQSLSEIEENGASIGSPAEAVGHLARVELLSAVERKKVVHGQPIEADDGNDDVVALVDGQQLIGIAERRKGLFKPRVILEG